MYETSAERPASPTGGPEADVRVEPPWTGLPESVRSRLAETAAAALGALPVEDVPAPLRRLARYTPVKRAGLGRAALLTELESSSAFRATVVAWWDEHRSGELSPSAGDPLTAAAAAMLTGDPVAPDAVALAARRGEAAE